MSRTGDKLKELEERIEKLESLVSRLMHDKQKQQEFDDWKNAEGLSQT